MLFNIPLMGKKDVNRPYPGYKIAYGSMTLAACRSAGYIPLTIKVTNDASNLSAGDYRGVSIQGVDSGIRLKTSGSATLTAQNYHIDLDSFYSGNLSKCKAVSSIKQLELEGSLYSPSFTYSVVKWLVPEV